MLWVRNSQAQTVASIPAAALSLVDVLTIGLLSYMEHTCSVRPSTLWGVFLLASLVLDIPQSQTLFLMGNQTPLAAVFTAAMGLKVILLMLEAQSKIQEFGCAPCSGGSIRCFSGDFPVCCRLRIFTRHI